MSQADLFKTLGAPLKNVRWSWGSVGDDGAVFLRVWEDQEKRIDGAWYTRIGKTRLSPEHLSNLGRVERQEHVALVLGGARCYMIMCQAVDVKARPRKIKSFNKNEVFPGGRISVDGEDVWVERLNRLPVGQLVAQASVPLDVHASAVSPLRRGRG